MGGERRQALGGIPKGGQAMGCSKGRPSQWGLQGKTSDGAPREDRQWRGWLPGKTGNGGLREDGQWRAKGRRQEKGEGYGHTGKGRVAEGRQEAMDKEEEEKQWKKL